MISSFRSRITSGAVHLRGFAEAAPVGSVLLILLTLALGGLVGPATVTAQDCEVRYRAGTSNSWVFITQNAGDIWTGAVNNLTAIQNAGRNDFTVRTSGILGATADNRLIATLGGGTLVLPPNPFVGLQLTRITCHAYATVYDASDYLDQFGSSAPQLAADAAEVAGDAVEAVQTEAANVFDQGMQQLYAEANALYTSVSESWQAFQDSVTSAGSQFPAAFGQAFPELQVALAATADYSYGLPASTTALWTSHAQGVQQALMELDQSLGVSQTVNEITSIDPARAFPELTALQNTRCDVDPDALARLEQREAQLERLLTDLGESAASVWPSEIADPFLRDLWAVALRMAEGPCQADLASLARSLQRDQAAMSAFLENAQRALGGVDVKALARRQEEFGTGIENLTNSTGRMMRLLLDQEQLEQAVEFRAVEVRQAEERLVGPTPDRGPGGVQWLSPAYWERRARQGDPDAVEVDAQALVTATERYEAAVRARGEGWDRVNEGWEQWTGDAAALGGLVPRLRIDVRGVDELMAALSNPPVPRTPASALGEAADCVAQGLRRLQEEANELARISKRFLAALVDSFQAPAVSPELARQLARVRLAHREAMQANRAVADAQRRVARSMAELSGAVVGLVGVLAATGPGGRVYLRRVDASLRGVRDGAEELVRSRALLNRSWDRAARLNAQRDEEVRRLVDLMLPDEPARAALLQANRDIQRDREAVRAAIESALACAGTTGRAATAVLSAHPARLDSYVDQVAAVGAEAVGNLVPPEVGAALDDALAAASALVSAYQSAAGSAATVGEQAQVVATAHAGVIGAIASADMTILPQRVTTARNAAMALWEEANLLLGARSELTGPQSTFVAELASLQGAMASAGLQAAWDGAGVAYDVLDLDLISDEYAGAQFVAERWAAAAGAMPTRVAILTGVDPTLTNTVNVQIQNMQTRLSSMSQCLSQGQTARTTLLAASLRSQAVAAATQGLQSEALGVINDLNSLLDPTQTLMDKLTTIFEGAASLSNRISGIGSEVVEEFNALASASISGVNTAASCLESGYTSVNGTALSVQSQLWPSN